MACRRHTLLPPPSARTWKAPSTKNAMITKNASRHQIRGRGGGGRASKTCAAYYIPGTQGQARKPAAWPTFVLLHARWDRLWGFRKSPHLKSHPARTNILYMHGSYKLTARLVEEPKTKKATWYIHIMRRFSLSLVIFFFENVGRFPSVRKKRQTEHFSVASVLSAKTGYKY